MSIGKAWIGKAWIVCENLRFLRLDLDVRELEPADYNQEPKFKGRAMKWTPPNPTAMTDWVGHISAQYLMNVPVRSSPAPCHSSFLIPALAASYQK